MTSSPLPDPLIGRLIDDRYQVRSRIARGGMATVYLATDLRLERRVALKVMHGHLSDDTNFKNRFIQEARSAARLADPNVVSVFDQGQDADMAYLVMEYLPGITLRDLLRDHGRLTARQVIDIMDAVTSGLAAAHRSGIVHRDLKPENVLLADDGRIKIGDFGLARAVTAQTGSGQALLGTIAYLSPELVTRGEADARSDIYALGIMMYEMLTGEQPYQGEQPMQIAYQHANESVPRPSAKVPQVPADLDDLVLWCTEREPEERPTDAGELLERLREVERHLGLSHSTPAPPTPTAVATTVFPALLGANDGADVTRVLTSPSVRTGPVDPHDQTSALSVRSNRRAKRGWWVLLLVLVLGIGSGTAGWYFGFGPGGLLDVPNLVGKPAAEAFDTLKKAEIKTERAEEYSLTVPADTVIATDPAGPTRIDKDRVVKITVSLGLKNVSLGALGGKSLEELRPVLAENNLTEGTITKHYSSKVAAGNILGVSVGGTDITESGETQWGQTLDFSVSAGPIPPVSGLSEDAARSALTGVGLQVASENKTEFSDTVPAGNVIAVSELRAGVVPDVGGTVTLVVSLGPDLVAVPDVTGKPVKASKKALEDAGFTVTVKSGIPQAVADLLGDSFTVAGTDPAGGTKIKRGAAVTIQANF
ncbi:Stk1 family PASTA domain-containing Ser/Thr kinase [Mycetocola lacteus]|uniref:non-specific serine/threonine protein kinase n=1 Tax=Mycetocola lacteus TaxID=76637 RepID=A0A3L7AR29_9MICO|nr:Stk1 family PASTA domain-containing Ser/Thr kinase [Mycetocola lacteus]RLP82837.1 Stk1 family PASTA domain-containing Ser/Thr kinase [Mycetocola lacteus]